MSDSQTNGPGVLSTIVTILLCTLVLGGLGGIISGSVGLPPAVMWAIVMPNVFVWLLLFRRRRAAPREPLQSEHVLLEASNTRDRVVQAVLPLLGVMLGIGGVTLLVRAGGGLSIVSVGMTVAAVGLIVLPLRTIIAWDLTYKGHAIRFENDPCFGERLLIDGQLVDRGGLGLHMELIGRIASGAGASDIIRVTSFAGIPTFRCRIVAVSPGPAEAGHYGGSAGQRA